MFDKKFLSHFARNTYFYFYIFLGLFLIKSFSLPLTDFLRGLIFAIFSVLPVYFLNDFADRGEDKKHNKPNLYLSLNKQSLFWNITSLLLILGAFFSFINSVNSFFLFISFYILNIFYSFLPFRLRDKKILREINIFAIYLAKSLLFLTFLKYSLADLPFLLVVIPGVIAILNLSFYKHYLGGMGKEIYFYLFLLLVILIPAAKNYPLILLIILPVIPLFLSVIILHKKVKIPINLFQFAYFLYALIIYFLKSFHIF